MEMSKDRKDGDKSLLNDNCHIQEDHVWINATLIGKDAWLEVRCLSEAVIYVESAISLTYDNMKL